MKLLKMCYKKQIFKYYLMKYYAIIERKLIKFNKQIQYDYY